MNEHWQNVREGAENERAAKRIAELEVLATELKVENAELKAALRAWERWRAAALDALKEVSDE